MRRAVSKFHAMPDFSLDIWKQFTKLLKFINRKLLFVATPNNPDGSLLEAKVVDELLKLPLLVVLDEAYIEFAGENLGGSLSRIREVSRTRKPGRLAYVQQMGRLGWLADRIWRVSALAHANLVEIQAAL